MGCDKEVSVGAEVVISAFEDEDDSALDVLDDTLLELSSFGEEKLAFEDVTVGEDEVSVLEVVVPVTVVTETVLSLPVVPVPGK